LNWKLAPLLNGPTIWNPIPYDRLIGEDEISAAVQKASTDALAKWKEASVQGLVFFAELQKTLDTLRHPLESLRKELLEGRARHGRDVFRKSLRGASGQYLTWFYGIKSIIYDIEGTLEALEAKSLDRYTARGNVTLSREWESVDTTLHQGSLLVDSKYRTRIVENVVIRAGLLGSLEHSTQSAFGFRLRDIPNALWELTPWSFVLDWFVNVGDVVDAYVSTLDNAVKAQWVTIVTGQYVERRVTSTTLASGTTWWVSQPSTDKDFALYTTKVRQPSNLANNVRLSFRSNLDRVPTLAALALVVTTLTKR